MTRRSTPPSFHLERNPGPRASERVLAELAARLTPRDLALLELVWEHRVLTTHQLTAIFFGSDVKARHRLLDLYRLTAVTRFRPWQPTGSAPWHWVLGPGGAIVLAAERGITPRELGHRRSSALTIATSQRLGHQIGVNEFFTRLHHHARTADDSSQLIAWWHENRCAKLWGDLARPDAYGRWAQDGQEIDFFLEHDTGSYPLPRVAAKLNDYAALAASTRTVTPVLFWLHSARREANLRSALDVIETVPVATATRTNDAGPAGAVWLPLGADEPRRRLIDLTAAWSLTRADEPAGRRAPN